MLGESKNIKVLIKFNSNIYMCVYVYLHMLKTYICICKNNPELIKIFMSMQW